MPTGPELTAYYAVENLLKEACTPDTELRASLSPDVRAWASMTLMSFEERSKHLPQQVPVVPRGFTPDILSALLPFLQDVQRGAGHLCASLTRDREQDRAFLVEVFGKCAPDL